MAEVNTDILTVFCIPDVRQPVCLISKEEPLPSVRGLCPAGGLSALITLVSFLSTSQMKLLSSASKAFTSTTPSSVTSSPQHVRTS
ncbi:hypothetical protein CgunFtcFv8_001503 [Champsocephalus gunnari]|uniref:Uncharacterized protein n=1 Tax=Champsocephalus gunnari TaxID=52237 RepID=A0AAN8CNI2_CHAGU|nr:hypothetical protein CgunFtcFv8_001503 [Champsocephalus gunnari]